MKRLANALFGLVLAACTSGDSSSHTDAPVADAQNSTTEAAEPPVKSPASTNNQRGDGGNVVDSGARVIVDLGSLKDLRSSDPLQHIYQRGVPGVSADRVYLSATIFSPRAGIT